MKRTWKELGGYREHQIELKQCASEDGGYVELRESARNVPPPGVSPGKFSHWATITVPIEVARELFGRLK